MNTVPVAMNIARDGDEYVITTRLGETVISQRFDNEANAMACYAANAEVMGRLSDDEE